MSTSFKVKSKISFDHLSGEMDLELGFHCMRSSCTGTVICVVYRTFTSLTEPTTKPVECCDVDVHLTVSSSYNWAQQ